MQILYHLWYVSLHVWHVWHVCACVFRERKRETASERPSERLWEKIEEKHISWEAEIVPSDIMFIRSHILHKNRRAPGFRRSACGRFGCINDLVSRLAWLHPTCIGTSCDVSKREDRTCLCVCVLCIKCTLFIPNLSYNVLTCLSECAYPGGVKIGGRKNPSESPQKHNTTNANSHVLRIVLMSSF
jgi:hypothetical protein